MNLNKFKLGIFVLWFALVAVPVFSRQDAQETPQSNQQLGQHMPPGRSLGAGRVHGMFGTVSSVGVNQFVMQDRDGAKTTVHVDSQTRLVDRQRPMQLADLKPGDHVMVRARASGSFPGGSEKSVGSSGDDSAPPTTGLNGEVRPTVVMADAVQRVPAGASAMLEGDRAFGRITALNGNQLTVEGRLGTKIIVVSSDTQIQKNGQPAAIGDFRVGDPIMAMGKEVNGKLMASRLATRPFPGPGGPGGLGRQGPGSQTQQGQQQGGAPPPPNP